MPRLSWLATTCVGGNLAEFDGAVCEVLHTERRLRPDFVSSHVSASNDLMFRPGCARTVQPRAGWESQNDDAGSQIFTSGMEHSALDSRRGVPRPAFLRTRPRVDQALAGSARAGELRRRSARNACRLRIDHTVKFHTIEFASESP